MQKKVIIGRLGSVYGVRGWIKVHSYTEQPENIFNYDWYVKHQNQWQLMIVEAYKTHGKGFIVKLEGCDDRNQAGSFTNDYIAIDRTQLPKLNTGEFYWVELIGLRVINTDGVDLGVVDHIFITQANDVLVVMNDKKRLLPFIKDVVKKISLVEKKIIVEWDEDY